MLHFSIIPEYVRCHVMFFNLHSSAFVILLDVLVSSSAECYETIVSAGDPGDAMHIIISGSAHIVEGELWRSTGSRLSAEVPNAGSETATNSLRQGDYQDEVILTAGDSFGEEVLFNFEPNYGYTIVAASDVTMYDLPQARFMHAFKTLPNLKQHMQFNVERSRIPTSKSCESL